MIIAIYFQCIYSSKTVAECLKMFGVSDHAEVGATRIKTDLSRNTY